MVLALLVPDRRPLAHRRHDRLGFPWGLVALAIGIIFGGVGEVLSSPQLWTQAVFVFFLFFANFAILFGPLLLMNMSQMQSFEPGDADGA